METIARMSSRPYDLIRCKDDAEWLRCRRMGVGGSDVAAIMGLSPWRSPIEVWADKTGRAEPEDMSGKPWIEWGNLLEPLVGRTHIAESYARDAARQAGWKAPDGTVAIGLTWVEKDRRRDQDNVTSGQKFLLDGLVEAGVIRDDSQRYVPQPSVNRIATDKDNPGVWVHIRRQ